MIILLLNYSVLFLSHHFNMLYRRVFDDTKSIVFSAEPVITMKTMHLSVYDDYLCIFTDILITTVAE